MRRRALRWAAGGALAILLLLMVVPFGIAAWIDAHHLQAPFVRWIAARMGRGLQVDGEMQTHLLSLQPSVVAQQVRIGNPAWTQNGRTAQIGRLYVQLERWPLFGRELEIRALEVEDATLSLSRDAEGRANWQASPPHTPGAGGGPPLIHSLTVRRTRLELDDAPRHLRYSGAIGAQDEPDARSGALWHLEGMGSLNGHAVSIALNGDPLPSVRRDRPYRFAFAERSSGTSLEGRGQITRPLDFRVLEVAAEARGEDLRDLYYLAGVSLPDTGQYRAAVTIARDHSTFRYSNLSIVSGASDLRGTLTIETHSGRARTEGSLQSDKLRSADVGAAAAGRAPKDEGRGLVLPDSPLPLNALRAGDAQVDYRTRELQLGRVPLRSLATHIAIEHGVLSIDPLSASLYQGALSGTVRLDSELASAPARGKLNLKVSNLQPTALEHAAAAPAFDGRIEARAELTGQGRSLHQLASAADGAVTAVVAGGVMRAAFVDLIGADFAQGLGLMLAKDQKEIAIRCGIAGFEAQHGDLRAQTLLLDTDPVLINGQGDIRLEDETLQFSLHGQPKSRHVMRLHQPVLVSGTLAHPKIGLQGSGPAQATKALAIGLVRAPLEWMGLVDADLARNADCAALLQTAREQGVPVKKSDAASPP